MTTIGTCPLCNFAIDLHNDLWETKQVGKDSKGNPIYENYHKNCKQAFNAEPYGLKV